MGIYKSKLRTFKLYVPAILLYLAVGLNFVYPLFAHHAVAEQVKSQLEQAQANESHQPAQASVSGTPARIKITRLGIDLPVAVGSYNSADKTWTLDESHIFVSGLSTSHPIISNVAEKQPLKTVFYGHHSSEILGVTDNLVPGDLLTVDTVEGNRFTYYYTGDDAVRPTDATILQAPRDTTPIVLITCTGPWDQSRRVMYFSLLDVKATPAGTEKK